jgi:hypothetical protein
MSGMYLQITREELEPLLPHLSYIKSVVQEKRDIEFNIEDYTSYTKWLWINIGEVDTLALGELLGSKYTVCYPMWDDTYSVKCTELANVASCLLHLYENSNEGNKISISHRAIYSLNRLKEEAGLNNE